MIPLISQEQSWWHRLPSLLHTANLQHKCDNSLSCYDNSRAILEMAQACCYTSFQPITSQTGQNSDASFLSHRLNATTTTWAHAAVELGCGSTNSAAEIWSLGRQMRPMNPSGDPRSYHRWSVWRPMDALGFAENVLEWKCRDDSTDALISNLHCSLVKCRPRLVHFEYFWLVAWSQQIIDWRTTQNWDGPPNQQPWVVR